MATAQRMRTSEKQISGWNAIFPNDVATQHQSLVFIKRMMALGVSCITYLRGIFPEDAYRTRYLEGMCVKILREDSRFPGASKVVKWMMGCFDALEKRFLRTIILGSIIESYQFKFKYTADGPKLDILSKNKQVSLQDTKKASILLIRKLFVLMQSLEILPNDVSLTMKLFYYDEVTPPEYQPPGFKQGECDAVWFEGTPVHFKVGDVPTPFHMMKVRVTTEKETMEQLEKENMLNEENETSVQGLEEVNSTPNVRNTVKEDTPFYQNITAHSELQRSVTNEQSFSESEKEIKQLVAKAAELNVSGKRTKLRKVLVQRNNLQDNGKVNEEPQKLSTTPAIKAVRAKKSISELDHTACDSAVLQEKITKRRRKN
ncbi:HORMA domain-containing protein 1-like isoform X2 [Scyliorhinus canicula]|uniref:HORMA domain-containing protein 1-like isoform X2 n=1 Tax=Scyliorhinus canicula TaxID=7830 RepID=UPI0018F3E92E|nr:HORMA domain-containing protein 1-like isoform X2 [Scyliorhinus canicula]